MSYPFVLVPTGFDAGSAIALRRADALAKILDAKVVVLHVAESRSWIDLLRPPTHATDAIAIQHLLLNAVESARAWCVEVLGAAAEPPAIMLKKGDVSTAILEAARDVDAELIVLGDAPPSHRASTKSSGAVASGVIRKARRPVLVARPERPNNAIVAATDLTDDKYPALREAARLGARLGAHVTFVHNVNADDYIGAGPGLHFAAHAPAPREMNLDQRRHELEDLARGIGDDIDAVVVMRSRSADAILEIARSQDADLVVVGARHHALSSIGSKGTAEIVAYEAVRSVLTVPLRGRGPVRWAS